MATITQMATSSALSPKANGTSVFRGKGVADDKANGTATTTTTKLARDTKYRHVFATHSLTRTSCLSHDTDKSPSFVGFRNLMILVLSTHPLPPMVLVYG